LGKAYEVFSNKTKHQCLHLLNFLFSNERKHLSWAYFSFSALSASPELELDLTKEVGNDILLICYLHPCIDRAILTYGTLPIIVHQTQHKMKKLKKMPEPAALKTKVQ
jgi:hypothetical protein